MNKDFILAVLKMAGIAVMFLILNLIAYQLPQLKGQDTNFVYPVTTVYLLFFGFSVIILFSLYQIAKHNASQVGYVFLALTSLKAVGSYFFVQPILSKSISLQTEKINFLVVFMLFLSIEAYFTASMLNKSQ